MGRRILDLAGKKFWYLTVIERAPERDQNRQAFWRCICDCGREYFASGSSIKRGVASSCGCKTQSRHGYRNTPTYSSWCNMMGRCYQEKRNSYPNYGGRGIKVAEHWWDFRNFLDDMGERPEGTTIDRIDNDGNYEPGNCRWSTPSEQNRNRRQHA